jgi:hypothetical protein
MLKRYLFLPFLLALSLVSTSLALAQDQDLVSSITTCFHKLADEIDAYVTDNEECTFYVRDGADGEAKLVANSNRRNELMTSTLLSFTRMWSNMVLLEPTKDASTFRIKSVTAAGDSMFVQPIHGGVYAYAYFDGAEAHMMRCNEQLASCVIYIEIAEYTQRVLQSSSQCFAVMMLSFPEPEQDEEIAVYMSSVLDFVSRLVAPADLARFQPVCADHRPGEKAEGED